MFELTVPDLYCRFIIEQTLYFESSNYQIESNIWQSVLKMNFFVSFFFVKYLFNQMVKTKTIKKNLKLRYL